MADNLVLLMSWILRASALFVLAALAAWLLRGGSAALRAGVWRAAFVGAAALPWLAFVAPPLGWLPARAGIGRVSQEAGATAPALDLALLDPSAAGALPLASSAESRAIENEREMRNATATATRVEWRVDLATLLALVYALGAAASLLALARGLARAISIARAANPTPSSLAGARVVLSDASEAPFVLDPRPFARPVLVLSRADGTGLASDVARLHEGQHLARRDGAWFLFARVVAALSWPSPLVWLALRRLRRESERAADDAVLRGGVRASDYAAWLLARTAHSAALPVPAMAGRRIALSERVEALLRARADRRGLGARGGVLVALFLAALVVPLAGLGRAAETSGSVFSTASQHEQEAAPDEPASAPQQDPEQPQELSELGARELALQDPPNPPLGDARLFAWTRGLAALVQMQDPATGAWRGDVGYKLNDSWQVTARDVPQVGVTALAVEALILGGQRPGAAPYAEALDRALAWLVACQDERGYLSAHGTRLREHGHALRALALASVVGAELPAGALERAAAFSLDARGEGVPGWRFEPGARDADILETAHQLHALRGAEIALSRQLDVASFGAWRLRAGPVIAGAEAFLLALRITQEDGGTVGAFRYQPDSHARVTANTTAAGLLALGDPELWRESLVAFEELRGPRIPEPPRQAGHFLTWDAELLARRALYSLELGNDARLSGDDPQARFRRHQLEWVLSLAQPDGRWRSSEGPGDAYTTAIACLLLAG